MADFEYTPGDDDQESPVKYLTVTATQPLVDQGGVIGGQVQISFTYAAVIPAEITLTWQIYGGGDLIYDWTDLVETPGFYEGVNTATLTIKAIDNFLGSMAPLVFRCKILFAGSVPTFTSQAVVVINQYLGWTPGCQNFTSAGSGATQFLAVGSPTPHGFTGPFTYQWNFVSGAPFTCTTPNDSLGVFSYAGPDGLSISVWTCTISNGSVTITSDPIYLAMFFGTVPNDTTTPFVSDRGAAFSSVPHFAGPWLLAATQRQRVAATPTVVITTPSAAASTFGLSGSYPGGTAIVGILNPQSNLNGTFVLGNTKWTRG